MSEKFPQLVCGIEVRKMVSNRETRIICVMFGVEPIISDPVDKINNYCLYNIT